MRFAKGHGTGNDFILLPDPDGEIDLTPAAVVALCDRHRGIGADGVLRVVRSAKDPAGAGMADTTEWFMDYRNSDGSLAQMCGNGIRVFALYLVESGLASGDDTLSIATRAGVVDVEVGPDGAEVDLFGWVTGVGSTVVDGITYTGAAVTVGNPNLVIRLPDEAALRAIDLSKPPVLAETEFPDRANVEFFAYAEPIDGADMHVSMRVYERGSGETLSCGSGACAVAAAVIEVSDLLAGRVVVDVPGGRLHIAVAGDMCRLSGPAVIVATGETTLP